MLHENQQKCVESHCDKHVVKMVIEYAQLLSTAHRVLDGTMYMDKTANGRNIKRWRIEGDEVKEWGLYKASHINHPCGIWVRQSDANYMYLHNLWYKLCKEYTHRYGKLHLTEAKLRSIICNPPKNIPYAPIADVHNMPQAMPDDAKIPNDIVSAYRRYYNMYTLDFARYTNREEPTWLRTGT